MPILSELGHPRQSHTGRHCLVGSRGLPQAARRAARRRRLHRWRGTAPGGCDLCCRRSRRARLRGRSPHVRYVPGQTGAHDARRRLGRT
nr:MAG TPA: hypothetical protein [Caudoviricetes sp.]